MSAHDDLELTPERKQIIVTWGILSRMTPHDQQTLVIYSESLPECERDPFLHKASGAYARREHAGQRDGLAFDSAFDATVAGVPDDVANVAREYGELLGGSEDDMLDAARQVVADYIAANTPPTPKDDDGGGGGGGGDGGDGAAGDPGLRPSSTPTPGRR